MYSFIQLSELRQCGVGEIGIASKRQQVDTNTCPLNGQSGAVTAGGLMPQSDFLVCYTRM